MRRELPVWSPPDDLQAVRASLLALTEQVLASDEVRTEEKRRLLREWLLWKWTEAAGSPSKYDLRYASVHAIEHRAAHGISDLRHEHVFPRKDLADAILHEPKSAAHLLRTRGIACVVTKTEAINLNASKGWGWQRYKDADVPVYDLLKGEPLDFDDLGTDDENSVAGRAWGPAPLTERSRTVRLARGDDTILRAQLKVSSDGYELRWPYGRVWVDAVEERYPHEILKEITELLPTDTRLLVCGTCPRLVLSGMALDMGGGYSGYCTVSSEPDLSDIVELASAGCAHHAGWPYPEPLVHGSDVPRSASKENLPSPISLTTPRGTATLQPRYQQPWTVRSPAGNRRLAPAEGRTLLALAARCPDRQESTCDCRAHQIMANPTPTAELFHPARDPH